MKRKLRIEGDGNPQTTKVYLDGKDISGMLWGIDVSIQVGKVPQIKLHAIADIEFDGEIDATALGDTVHYYLNKEME